MFWLMRYLASIILTILCLVSVSYAEISKEVERLKNLAEQGFAGSQWKLAYRYANGIGVPEDDAEAVKWYRKAAEQGYADAQLNLGYMYSEGIGVPEDDVVAYMWYNLAAAQNNSIAKENKDIIVKVMTKEQIAEAQKMSREWMAKRESDE